AVLTAISGPAAPAEMTDQDLIVGAFRSRPRSAEASPSVGRYRRRHPVARVNTRIAVATALVGVVVGGATVAAAAGAFPTLLPGRQPSHGGHGPPASPAVASGLAGTSTRPSAATPRPPATAAEQLRGLCQAYQQAVSAGRTPSPDSPAFERLRVTA